MYKNYVFSVAKLLTLFVFIFFSCEEIDDPISIRTDDEDSGWPHISNEKPELKIIQIGDDKIAYHAYSDGTNLIDGDIAISDEMLAKLNQLSKDPSAQIDDIVKRNGFANGRTNGNGLAQNSNWNGGTYYYYVNPQLPGSTIVAIDAAIDD